MRLARRLALACLVMLVVFAGATAWLFVWPRQDTVQAADAAVVLSGDFGERLPIGLRLVREGVAPVLVLDGTPDLQEVLELCKGGAPFEVVCLHPDPDGTRPEARAAADLAAERGWRTMIVVTSTFHVTRARTLFERCFDGDIDVVGGRPPYGWRMSVRAVVHEWGGLAHAFMLARGC